MHFKGFFFKQRSDNITLCGQRLEAWFWEKFNLYNICVVLGPCFVSVFSIVPVTTDC